ncbi:MAG: histidinol-phosphatase, partial [Rufibacter sp.]
AGVTYTIQFWGAKKVGGEPKRQVLKEVKGTKANYRLEKDDLYVRAKIISSKPQENPYQPGDRETAWTQPVKR